LFSIEFEHSNIYWTIGQNLTGVKMDLPSAQWKGGEANYERAT